MTFWLTRTHQFHFLPVLARRLPEYHNKVIVKLLLLCDRIANTHVQTKGGVFTLLDTGTDTKTETYEMAESNQWHQ